MDGLIQFFSEYNYDGIVYGLIDNGVLGFSTLLGIDIDRYFRGSGIHGAIYGALLGNTLSDFLGAIVDFPLLLTINITAGHDLSLGEIKAVGDCIEGFASEEAIIVTGTVLDEDANNDLTVTVIATGLNSSLQSVATGNNQRAESINVRKPLPLSDAAQQLLENPPSVEKAVTKDPEKEDDYLDIPSFVRTQLD